MSTTTLPRWCNDIIDATPNRGGGLNRWLIRAAIALRACGRSEQEIIAELRVLTADEPIKAGEIERAAQRSADYLNDNGPVRTPTKKWPAPDVSARAAIVAQHDAGAADLWELSPYRLEDDTPLTEEIIDTLFPGNPLICVAPSQYESHTAPRDHFRDKLANMQFIVPSAMSALTGINQEGEVSTRCLDNTGPRQYLVVEQDDGTEDEQTAVIMHLAQQAPLVLVVRSGGKSLHSWFPCGAQSEVAVRRFFAHAVRLGADPATWTPCQLVRMPDGTRRQSGGKRVRQSVLYWNPSAGEGTT